jgi:hypothetical protein
MSVSEASAIYNALLPDCARTASLLLTLLVGFASGTWNSFARTWGRPGDGFLLTLWLTPVHGRIQPRKMHATSDARAYPPAGTRASDPVAKLVSHSSSLARVSSSDFLTVHLIRGVSIFQIAPCFASGDPIYDPGGTIFFHSALICVPVSQNSLASKLTLLNADSHSVPRTWSCIYII